MRLDLACQVFGAGEDLVLVSGGLSHLEVAWELAELAAFLGRLARFRRVIVFDKRGTGMSDPVAGVPGLEEHVDDVIAVMDAAGSARACVMGWFDAAFVAAMFAATYPERVSALILGGLWLKALAGRPETLTPDPDVAKIYADGIESGWRHGALAELVAPSYAGDERFRSWWRRLEVYSATPAVAAGLLQDHHAHVRRLLKRFRGVEIDTAGDGFFATFDGRRGPSAAHVPSAMP